MRRPLASVVEEEVVLVELPEEVKERILLSDSGLRRIEDLVDYRRMLSVTMLNKNYQSLLFGYVEFISPFIVDRLTDTQIQQFKSLKEFTLPILSLTNTKINVKNILLLPPH